MGFLKTDYSNTGDFSALPIGEYECIISATKMKPTQAGEQMVNVELTVREDIDQPGKKRKFFDTLLVRDTMMWKFNQVAKAVELPEGEDIATPEDFAAAILYKPVRIKNKHELYNGENQDRVATYKVTQVEGNGEYAVGGQPESIDISDDDLPF